jgi:hypothetical protein
MSVSIGTFIGSLAFVFYKIPRLGLFSWRIFLGSATVALFVLFGNLCPIMD